VIVDSSAIVAILGLESDARELAEAVEEASERHISVVNYVEAAIVLDSRHNPVLSRRLDDFLREAQVLLEPVTVQQARVAREAYRDFGKSRHRAGLNLGDCFAYALAKEKGEPLLYKGDDFRRTDIESAEY
jgi:ribonuclease VapC